VPQRVGHGEYHLKWALDGQAVPAGMGPGCGRSNQHMVVTHVQGKLVTHNQLPRDSAGSAGPTMDKHPKCCGHGNMKLSP